MLCNLRWVNYKVARVKKFTADAQILIFKIWKNIYQQMKPIK